MKVWPTSEEKRKILSHPVGGKFREKGHADWPDDSFTFRRMRDGDITMEEPKTVEAPKVEEPVRVAPRKKVEEPK